MDVTHPVAIFCLNNWYKSPFYVYREWLTRFDKQGRPTITVGITGELLHSTKTISSCAYVDITLDPLPSVRC